MPIYKEDKVVGGVIGTFTVEYFTHMLAKSVYDDIGATMIMQADGKLVSGYEGMEQYPDMYAMLRQFSYPMEAYDPETFKRNVKKGNCGFIYEKDGKQRYVSYRPIGIRDWYVVNLVMAEQLSPRFQAILIRSLLFAISNAVVIAVLLLLLFLYWRKIKQQSLQHQNARRFQIITGKQEKAVIFEYDMHSKQLTFSDNFKKTFGRDLSGKLRVSDLENFLLNTEVLDTLRELIKAGQHIDLEVQLLGKQERPVWFAMQAEVIFDAKKQPESVVGFLVDIDEQKRKQSELLEKMELNDLTGIYAREALKKHMNMEIQQHPNRIQAVMFVDLDDFKQVNDTYGHAAGDDVLIQAAKLLKQAAGIHGFAARYGGDEFVLFLKDGKDEQEIMRIASFIQEHPIAIGTQHCTFSIGIAISIQGDDCEELLAHADQALYEAKKNGKSQYRLYEASTN